MISGKPVKSSIERTSIPASASSRALPPVETISTSSSRSPRASSTSPRLSETDSSARRMRTSPGAACSTPPSRARCRGPCPEPIPAPGPAPARRDPPRVGRVGRERAGREQPHGLRQQRVLERAQRREHLLAARRARAARSRAAGSPGRVHAGVDEVDRDAEHLHAVGERLLDRADAGEGRQQRGVDVDDRAREAARGSARRAAPCSRRARPAARPAPRSSRRAPRRAPRGRRSRRARTPRSARRARGRARARAPRGVLEATATISASRPWTRVEQRLEVGAAAGDEHGDRQRLAPRRADDSCAAGIARGRRAGPRPGQTIPCVPTVCSRSMLGQA